MANLFFFLGVGTGVAFVVGSVTKPGEDKRMTTAFPFLMLLASAVAKYIGM